MNRSVFILPILFSLAIAAKRNPTYKACCRIEEAKLEKQLGYNGYHPPEWLKRLKCDSECSHLQGKRKAGFPKKRVDNF
ncbi:unnamed protein product [Cylicocyclus nassatus]|uniref:Uncharacterized protein n=1 Tax=Cylicocyclus nassatus TaxID=53992 RepID=A0AA36DKB2_CYLNA|nr:unnamed protein product [Cylicocyclus nassatus]